MAGCHTLLICAHPCNLWENILRQKLLWFLWLLWEDSLVAAWVWQGCHTLLQLYRLGGLKFCVFCAIRGRISQQEISVRICAICGRKSCVRKFCGFCGFCGKIVWWVRGYGRDAIPSYSLHCLLCWCSGDHCTPWSCPPLKFATRLQNIFPNFVKDYFSLSD